MDSGMINELEIFSAMNLMECNSDQLEIMFQQLMNVRMKQYEVKMTQVFDKLNKLEKGQEIFKDETNIKLDKQEDRVEMLEDNMTINSRQCGELRRLGADKIAKVLEGKNSELYKILSGKAFANLWGSYIRSIGTKYVDTPTVEFERGKEFVENWTPSKNLKSEIYDFLHKI